MTTTDLEIRLAALEARVPAGHEPPVLPVTPSGVRRGGRLAPIALAPALLLVAGATAVAGGAVVSGLMAQARPGAQNPGQPLEGAQLECMTPAQAATYLSGRGFANVVWQVETGRIGDKASGGSRQQATAPAHGYVVPGSFMDDGQLIIVVDQRSGATGTGACVDMPMP